MSTVIANAHAADSAVRVEQDLAVDAFRVYDAMRAPGLGSIDPITVMLRDFGGSGQIVVECYGAAWSAWFGAIGSATLRQFLVGCDEYYLGGKLANNTTRKTTKREEAYVCDIARAVIKALKGGAA